MFYGRAAVNRSAVCFVGEKSDGFPKQDKHSAVFCLAQAILSQPLVLKFCKLLLPSFAIIGTSDPDN